MIHLARMVFLCAGLMYGCMPNEADRESEVSGAFPLPDALIPIPKAKSPSEIAAFSNALASDARRITTTVYGIDAIKNLRLILIREVKARGGIPRTQLKEVFEILLDDASTACSGVACSRVFGIEKDEIDEFLDATYRELSADQVLTKQENSALRKIYLGSFKRGPGETVPPAKSLPVQVMYKLAKFSGKSGITIADPNFHFMVEFYPGDLKKAHKLSCTNETCEATVLKPVSVALNIPVILNSQVIVRYQIGMEHGSGMLQHEAFVGGRITPVTVGKILNINVDFWAELEQSARTNYRTVIKKFDCGGSVYCNTPWFSVGAIMGRDGIHFDPYITAAASVGSFMKVGPALPAHSMHIEYKDLPEKIRKIKQAIDSGSLGEPPHLDPDILWAAFTGAAPQSGR